MLKLVTWIQRVVLPFLGPGGLLLASFLDSSFLSLPEISDLLVVTSSANHPEGMWVPIAMATLGSVVGCSVLWWLGNRGGEAFLLRRFGVERVESMRGAFRRWDLLTLAVPAVLPPPMPFKVFVISAGALGLPFKRLVMTLLLARGFRYSFWALLGALYGAEAHRFLRFVDQVFVAKGGALGYAASAVLLGAVLFVLLRRARRRETAGEVQ